MSTNEKLIRDKLVQRIPADQIRIETDPEQLDRFLKAKLNEEVGELMDTDCRDLGEFADVLEVLQALAQRAGIAWREVENARIVKRMKKGGFDDGVIYQVED